MRMIAGVLVALGCNVGGTGTNETDPLRPKAFGNDGIHRTSAFAKYGGIDPDRTLQVVPVEERLDNVSLDGFGVLDVKLARGQLRPVLCETNRDNNVVLCNGGPDVKSEITLGVDLDNVVNLEFSLVIALESDDRTSRLADRRVAMDPIYAIRGGELLPFPVVERGIAPIGQFDAIHVRMEDIVAVNTDGSRFPVDGALDHVIEQRIEVKDCGRASIRADWILDATFIDDTSSLGVGFTFENLETEHDSTGC